MSAQKKQILLVLGAVVLFVLLFISPKIESSSKKEEKANASQLEASKNLNLDVYLDMAVKSLGSDYKKEYDAFLQASAFDSLLNFWDQQKRPDLASYFAEKIAKEKNLSGLWEKAGNRYYYAVQFVQDQSEIPVLYQKAINCFGKAVELDPKNTDAKIMLASCYVEGSSNPMEGVNRLKAIEKTDSMNLKLQLTFAFFSVRSGQLDKAIERFNKVLRIDSTYLEAYLHLADIYEKKDDKEQTLRMLESYAALTNDPTARIEIRKYIEQLKTKN